jgi:hypothetical protein
MFWAAYIRKENKKDAKKAWFKIQPDEKLANVIIYAITMYAKWKWSKSASVYTPLASTFLNGERWENDIQAMIAEAKKDEKMKMPKECNAPMVNAKPKEKVPMTPERKAHIKEVIAKGRELLKKEK